MSTNARIASIQYNAFVLLENFTSQFQQGVMISLGINANCAPENKQLINLKRVLKDLKTQQTTSNALLSCWHTRTCWPSSG